MTYLYENSNFERFQQLSQALLLEAHPSLQCFPVGQPDGGRDALDPGTKTVVQVKFKRADEVDENADWMISALEGELPKIKRLAEQGAREYVMVTNARGTAHPEVGRIDRVQTWMNDNLPITGQCLWRDDLDPRLDRAPAGLKFRYSEILTLETGLEVILRTLLGAGQDQERRSDAIRAFVARQYRDDSVVKFKQVNLSNDLLGLFVDVPIGLKEARLSKATQRFFDTEEGQHFAWPLTGNVSTWNAGTPPTADDGNSANRPWMRRRTVGTAELLLGDPSRSAFKRTVLEGAPGQGKSTLAQFVCQVHRMRFLEKKDELARIPDAYRRSGFRVPFKIDLRDFAAFLDGKSPFTGDLPPGPPSLDNFLAYLVTYRSGGTSFNAHDVLQLVKEAPILLFFDGLDEVADYQARTALIKAIGDAIGRWEEFDADFQMVVTSRPAVFGRAPNFRPLEFESLTLKNVEGDQITEYSDKWIVAGNLDESDADDVRKILADKLELPHIHDLTRNPMQLTILLTLIHQFGYSLPDQRTDLYKHYLDLFLIREAAKSLSVREHQKALVQFIGHLAWVLQSQAEASRASGSISEENLVAMARDFLDRTGRNSGIADNLFEGGLERVFVLVQRIEGLYEFEVQPLREYFCAQYLYETAPVGTYRNDKISGDRVQRFEALAANPFWFNVCRFYAGFCGISEVATLVLSIEETIKTGTVAESIQAHRVGLALLQDWVFSNSKYPQRQLIERIFDELGLEMLETTERRSNDRLYLDLQCGQEILRRVLFDAVIRLPYQTRGGYLSLVLRLNGGENLEAEFLAVLDGTHGRERGRLFDLMCRAGATDALTADKVWKLIILDTPDEREMLVRSLALLNTNPGLAVQVAPLVAALTTAMLGALLDAYVSPGSKLGACINALSVHRNGFLAIWQLTEDGDRPAGSSLDSTPPEMGDFLRVLVENTEDLLEDEHFLSLENPQVRLRVAESCATAFPNSVVSVALAVAAASVESRQPGTPEPTGLFDSASPLTKRARASRMRRNPAGWWQQQLNEVSNDLERFFWCAMVVNWTSPHNLVALADDLNREVSKLPSDLLRALRNLTAAIARGAEIRHDRRSLPSVDVTRFTPAAAYAVAVALKARHATLTVSAKQQKDAFIEELVEDLAAMDSVAAAPHLSDTQATLDWAAKVEVNRTDSKALGEHVWEHLHRNREPVPDALAQLLLSQPLTYPQQLISRAIQTLEAAYKARTLQSVAQTGNWEFV